MSSDPLRLVWDALDARDCHPKGRPYDFRAQCPAHDGKNRTSLHVAVGADGRAVVYCFAHGCTVEAICESLGMSVVDLFPDGHHRGRHFPAPRVRHSDFTGSAAAAANTLYALEKVREPWQLLLASDCPFCGSRGAWLTCDSNGRTEVDCPEGCTPDNYTQSLLGRLQEMFR